MFRDLTQGFKENLRDKVGQARLQKGCSLEALNFLLKGNIEF